MEQAERNRVPALGTGYKKEGCRWRVVDNTAGVVTLRNGHGVERTMHTSGLEDYQPLKKEHGHAGS